MEATFEAPIPARTARPLPAAAARPPSNGWRPAFLTQRFINEHPAAPSGIAIIGAGAEPETFTQHYYDSRGVARIYQMTLDGGIWKLWREAPGFWQRYTGQISDDGNKITGDWEGSADGQTWKHDFSLTYIKTSQAT